MSTKRPGLRCNYKCDKPIYRVYVFRDPKGDYLSMTPWCKDCWTKDVEADKRYRSEGDIFSYRNKAKIAEYLLRGYKWWQPEGADEDDDWRKG